MITTLVLVSALASEVTLRASLAYNGRQVTSPCALPCVSRDGRYIGFHTNDNLDDRIGNPRGDGYARDLLTGRIERVTVANDGSLGNDLSSIFGFSADNRFVVYDSEATNMVFGDTNGMNDIFVRDRLLQTTEMVSVTHDGQLANGVSEIPSISGDGRFVVFDSNATNLVPSDTNGKNDIFVRDRWLATTLRVSVSSTGEQADRDSWGASISADGRYVVFQSYARNLIPDDTNRRLDVYLHDMQTGETERVSTATDGTEGNSDSNLVFASTPISADGRFVTFFSTASNLVPGDTNRSVDTFVRDRWTGETKRVSLRSDGGQGNHGGGDSVISADGRYICFFSASTNMTNENDANGTLADLFMRDTMTGETWRITNSTAGEQADNWCGYQSMSASGLVVVFQSQATNLAPNDTNGFMDVFVHINSRLRR
ncbi:MAG: hypothetical protein U0R49_02160 [Fimbriimonadales bacterium]